jgi:hypothetical protein
MRPERVAELVARWVRNYTRDLPAAIADRRVAEIEADLHDHIEHGRDSGLDDRRIAREIASRMIRGLAADVAWRRRQARRSLRRSTKENTMKTSKPLSRSVVRVTLGVALILALHALAMLVTDQVVWTLSDFVFAGVLLTILGIVLELVARRAGNLLFALGIGALGVASAVFGEADDAPGLVLLGILLAASACALAVRRARRSTAGSA